MFNLLFKTQKIAQPPKNEFVRLAVEMPEFAQPTLRYRLTTTYLNALCGAKQPHDLTQLEMHELDARLTQYDCDAEHIFPLDGRELGHLRRFVVGEINILSSPEQDIANPNEKGLYLALLKTLLLRLQNPTHLQNLSFLPSEPVR